MDIKRMGDNDLLQLWRNCMEAVRAKKPNADKARSLIGAMHDERMEEAVRHWSEYLEYIEQVWEPQVK